MFIFLGCKKKMILKALLEKNSSNMVFQRLFDIILCSEVGVGQEILTLLHGGRGRGLDL